MDVSDLLPLTGQTDHLLQSNLSHVLCINGQFEQALEKAERACNLQPEWPKVCAILELLSPTLPQKYSCFS